MSSYTLGDDIMYGGFGKKFVKFLGKSPVGAAVKFVAHPVKESKAALKTISRFDPTSKTAKYGNITKGILAASALTAAAILTGGGALAVGAGIASAAGTGIGIGRKPVRKPPKTIASVPTDSIQPSAVMEYAAPAMANAADAAIAASATGAGFKPASTDKLSPTVIIGCAGVAIIALALFSSKKGS
jgi:hypothetical protein